MVVDGSARFSGRWCAGNRRSEEMRSNDNTLRSHWRFVCGNGDLQHGWLPVLGQDLQLGGLPRGGELVHRLYHGAKGILRR